MYSLMPGVNIFPFVIEKSFHFCVKIIVSKVICEIVDVLDCGSLCGNMQVSLIKELTLLLNL